MLSLTVTLVVLALSWALAYVGAPLLVWTAVVTVAYAALLVAGLLGTVGAAILGVPLLLMLAFYIVPLRRGVLTRGLFERFNAVMPVMSLTGSRQLGRPSPSQSAVPSWASRVPSLSLSLSR